MTDQAIPRGSRVTIQFVGTVLSDVTVDAVQAFIEGPGVRPSHFNCELITSVLPPIQTPGATVGNTATDEYGEVVVHDPSTASYVVRVGDGLQVWPDDQHTVPTLDPKPDERFAAHAGAVAEHVVKVNLGVKCEHCGRTDGDHNDDCPDAIPF